MKLFHCSAIVVHPHKADLMALVAHLIADPINADRRFPRCMRIVRELAGKKLINVTSENVPRH